MFARGETVTRLRATAASDRYSGTDTSTRTWSTATSLAIPGWGVSQDATGEPQEAGRDAVVSDFTLYRQEPADVTAQDRLIVRGLTCEVVGRPFSWTSPLTGWAAGFVVKVNVVEG